VPRSHDNLTVIVRRGAESTSQNAGYCTKKSEEEANSPINTRNGFANESPDKSNSNRLRIDDLRAKAILADLAVMPKKHTDATKVMAACISRGKKQ